MKQSNVEVQAGRDGPGYVQEKIMNIENNINARGVRQSNFKISFEKNGKPAPVKLNKDHAMTIIAPAPTGHADKYPHVLHNVCSKKLISNSLPKEVKQKLKLQDSYTDFDLVATIWQHFYAMVQILRHDPPPSECLNHTEMKGSTCVTDYTFGYSDGEKEQYKLHAESFYQLFKLRYTTSNLTPYMMKLIDHAPTFMSALPFSLGRFQAEGGEHTNYLHNRYFFAHTTRGGGASNRVYDPMLCTMCNMYKRISYSIMEDTSPDGKMASEAFIRYRDAILFECSIPKGTDPLRLIEESLIKFQSEASQPETGSLIFSGQTFVFCGCVPKQNGKTISRDALKILILQNGGRVKGDLPGARGSKNYILITNRSLTTKQKLPSQIRKALIFNYDVVDYSYIFDAIEKGSSTSIEDYTLKFEHCPDNSTKVLTRNTKFFKKKHSQWYTLSKTGKDGYL
ncbi:hypothetical protein HOLleu_33914 [Holothuria leucospilota]|uniref:BRCT domain-containing protein n=1 Tax=Holothuria leucospilota TaxID=206669 RepID=A0A9Q0YPG2_HOLLE|nr:hypothetical protein HOLleu_33914 [Holothuria leucospilota]